MRTQAQLLLPFGKEIVQPLAIRLIFLIDLLDQGQSNSLWRVFQGKDNPLPTWKLHLDVF